MRVYERTSMEASEARQSGAESVSRRDACRRYTIPAARWVVNAPSQAWWPHRSWLLTPSTYCQIFRRRRQWSVLANWLGKPLMPLLLCSHTPLSTESKFSTQTVSVHGSEITAPRKWTNMLHCFTLECLTFTACLLLFLLPVKRRPQLQLGSRTMTQNLGKWLSLSISIFICRGRDTKLYNTIWNTVQYKMKQNEVKVLSLN